MRISLRMRRACARSSINIYWCNVRRAGWIIINGLYFAPSGTRFLLLFLSPNSPSPLSLFLLSTLACARASMYVFIDVTRDSRTQLTARKHRMYREYTSVFRVRLWHPLSAEARECRSRFLYDINPCNYVSPQGPRFWNNAAADPENESYYETMIKRPRCFIICIQISRTCDRVT